VPTYPQGFDSAAGQRVLRAFPLDKTAPVETHDPATQPTYDGLGTAVHALLRDDTRAALASDEFTTDLRELREQEGTADSRILEVAEAASRLARGQVPLQPAREMSDTDGPVRIIAYALSVDPG
jgi:hypothetical protein